jgi:hypothetical protein
MLLITLCIMDQNRWVGWMGFSFLSDGKRFSHPNENILIKFYNDVEWMFLKWFLIIFCENGWKLFDAIWKFSDEFS